MLLDFLHAKLIKFHRLRPLVQLISACTPCCLQYVFLRVCFCRQDKTILSYLDPVSNFQVFSNPPYISDWTVAIWKLGRDKTNVHTADTDKTLLSCPCRWCEQAIMHAYM